MNARFVVAAGWLLDGSGQPAMRRVAVEVDAGKVVRIGAQEDVLPGETVLDFGKDTLLPCLVDSHVHLFMSGTTDLAVRERQLSAGYAEAARGIEERIGRHAGCGVMAARDGGDAHGHTLRFRSERLAERFPSFTLRAAGRAWRNQGRYGKMIGRPPGDGMSLADSIAGESGGIDHVKIVNSGLNSLLSFGRNTPPQFSTTQLSAAVRAAEALGLKVMVHANGPAAVGQAVDAGCHSIEHGFFMGEDNLEKMAARGTVWVPTAVTMKAYAESPGAGAREAAGAARNLEHQLRQIASARRLGVAVAVGSDAGSPNIHHGAGCIEEIRLLTAAGFSIQEAVSSATEIGARLLGVERAGRRLAAGRPASFLVCPGGPEGLCDSLYRLKAVFVEGRRCV